MAPDNELSDFEKLTGLSPLSSDEVAFCQRLLPLFALVSSQKPEKGMRTLILRARARVDEEQLTLQETLDLEYEGAKARTEARLRLLGNCTINLNQE